MTFADLQAQFWSDADDAAVPHIFAQADVKIWLNEAQDEACMRSDLIEDSSTTAVCQIAVTAGTSSYALHAKLLRVTYIAWQATGETDRTELKILARNEVDRVKPEWRTCEEDTPDSVIVTGQKVRITGIPQVSGTLILECTRLPLTAMSGDTDLPEIAALHHRGLIQWALHRAYSKPDSEVRDPGRAKAALDVFERLFGLREDSDMRRASEAGPQFNKAFL